MFPLFSHAFTMSLPPRTKLDQMGLSQINVSTNRLSSPAGKRVPQTNHQASGSRGLGIPSKSDLSPCLSPSTAHFLLIAPDAFSLHTRITCGSAVQLNSR